MKQQIVIPRFTDFEPFISARQQKSVQHVGFLRNRQISFMYYKLSFLLVAFSKLPKMTVSFIISVCVSVHVEQLSSHWMDFNEIYIGVFFEELS
jgi:hypothetical protein